MSRRLQPMELENFPLQLYITSTIFLFSTHRPHHCSTEKEQFHASKRFVKLGTRIVTVADQMHPTFK